MPIRASRRRRSIDSMTKTVGILGGGQLARMLVLAGAPLGVRFVVVDSAEDACAGQVAPLVRADWRDFAALESFAAGVDVATFDFENVPAETAQWLAERTRVFPNPRALAIAQDRLEEKTLFRECGLGTPDFAVVDSRADLDAALRAIGTPAILKTRRLGYDGKGQFRLKSADDAEAAWAAPGGNSHGLILEAFVPFDAEVSVVAVRARDGDFRTWPLTRNWHSDGILSASLAPAHMDHAIAQAAFAHAKTIADSSTMSGCLRWSCSCATASCSATKWRHACTTPGTGPSRARSRRNSRTTCARCSDCRSAIPLRSAAVAC